jgi:hypothetical protein
MLIVMEDTFLDVKVVIPDTAPWYEVVAGSTVLFCTFSYTLAKASFRDFCQALASVD